MRVPISTSFASQQMTSLRQPILEQAALLSDSTRCRLLLVLERQELTVSELCTVLQMPQSTVSRHLKALRDQAWVDSRRDGTRRFYTSSVHSVPEAQRRLWMLIRESVSSSNGQEQDLQRLREVLTQRSRRSQEFFDSTAAHWDAVRQELFGDRFDLYGLLAFSSPDWVVGDLGCGTGGVASRLAPFVDRVIAVDSSPAMLRAAQARVTQWSNVDLRQGALESLPIADGELDVALVFLTLHHVAEPRKVILEAARALKKGGSLILVDMQPHDRESYQAEMGHVWLGFSEDYLQTVFSTAGLSGFAYRAIPVDLAAKGPALFVARGQLERQSQELLHEPLAPHTVETHTG